MDSCESTENSGHAENSTKTITEEKEEKAKKIVKAVGVAAVGLAVAGVVGLAVWGIRKILGAAEPSSNRKMMKAPGRNYYIFRDEFESDPASHFRSLRE